MSESTYPIISRAEAKRQGLKFYFTGKPCKHGHLVQRRIANNSCVACSREQSQKNYFDNIEESRRKSREWHKNNPEKSRKMRERFKQNNPEYNEQYYDKNQEIIKQRALDWYQVNTEQHADNMRKWRKNNRERSRELGRKFYIENKEQCLANSKKWHEENLEHKHLLSCQYYQTNKDIILEKSKTWKKDNPHRVRLHHANRREALRQSTPGWLNDEQKQEIQDIYNRACLVQEDSGILHHVDHIVPLRGKKVCGLHVPWNLQIIEATANLSKNNTFEVG